MPTIILRIFLLYKLLNAFILFLIPKKLRFLLPISWFPLENNNNNCNNNNKAQSQNQNQNQNQNPSLLKRLPSLPLKRMDPAELKRVFQMFDRNGDGRITKEELSNSLENLGIFIPVNDLETMIERIDVNGDGCVDIEEFGALYQSIMQAERGEEEEEDIKEAFNVYDQNGDGFITVDELKSVLSSLGINQGRTIEDYKRMIMKVDMDGNGMVDYQEFKQMMKGTGFSALS